MHTLQILQSFQKNNFDMFWEIGLTAKGNQTNKYFKTTTIFFDRLWDVP